MKRIRILQKLTPFFSAKAFMTVLIFLCFATALSVSYPFLYKLFIDQVLFEGNMETLKFIFLLMAAWLFFHSLFQYGLCKARTAFVTDVLYKIKQHLFLYLAQLSLHDSLQTSASEKKRVMEDDCNELETFFINHIFEFLLNILNACCFTTVMAAISPSLSAGCMVFFCFSYVQAKFIKRAVAKNAAALRTSLSHEDHIRWDELNNIKEIKCFNCENETVQSFHDRSAPLIRLIKKEKVYWYVNKYLSAMNHDLITRFFIYILGGRLVVESQLSVSSFLIFLGFYENFVKQIRKIMDSNFNLNSRINQLEKIIACLSFIPEKELAAMPSIAIPPIQRIRLHNVSFQYSGGRNIRYVLKALNGEFRKGETCLIQGKSGCGKSTLMKLLYRELEGYEGNILFNEQELRSCPNIPAYFGQIAVASFDSRLFHMTIRENLLFAAPNATEHQLYEACSNARFEEDMKNMPKALDTPVGENGSALSGGQRQRLIMARLFLRPADLYIIDEALDEISMEDEIRIINRLRYLNPDSIIIVVSHRLNSLKNAHEIQL